VNVLLDDASARRQCRYGGQCACHGVVAERLYIYPVIGT